ncbi:MAG: hypothetical protein U1D30_25625 [Planctomycetota bacterium]
MPWSAISRLPARATWRDDRLLGSFQGGRQRNNCIDCHAPTPAYPVVHPARGPNDRFLKGDHHE